MSSVDYRHSAFPAAASVRLARSEEILLPKNLKTSRSRSLEEGPAHPPLLVELARGVLNERNQKGSSLEEPEAVCKRPTLDLTKVGSDHSSKRNESYSKFFKKSKHTASLDESFCSKESQSGSPQSKRTFLKRTNIPRQTTNGLRDPLISKHNESIGCKSPNRLSPQNTPRAVVPIYIRCNSVSGSATHSRSSSGPLSTERDKSQSSNQASSVGLAGVQEPWINSPCQEIEASRERISKVYSWKYEPGEALDLEPLEAESPQEEEWNAKLLQFLMGRSKDFESPQPDLALRIEERACLFFDLEIDTLFRKNQLSFKQFLISEEKIVGETLHFIQSGGVLWLEILPNFRRLFHALDLFLVESKKISSMMVPLYAHLKKLTSIKEPDRNRFAHELFEFVNRRQDVSVGSAERGLPKEISLYFLRPLGRNDVEIKAVIDLLRIWCSSSLMNSLKLKAWGIGRQVYQVHQILNERPSKVQGGDLPSPASIDPGLLHAIDSFSIEEIRRTWIRKKGGLNLQSALINGRVLCANKRLISSSTRAVILGQDAEHIFPRPPRLSRSLKERTSAAVAAEEKQIYETCLNLLPVGRLDLPISEQVQLFLQPTWSDPIDVAAFPWLTLFKATSDEAWKIGEKLFLNWQAKIFRAPCYLKIEEEGKSLAIEARQPGDFGVAHYRSATVYWEDQGKDSKEPSMKKPVLALSLRWQLNFSFAGWACCQPWIESYTILDENYWPKIREHLVGT